MTECEMIVAILLGGWAAMTIWLTLVLRNHRSER